MLMAAMMGLLVGPLLHLLWPERRHWRLALDGFVLASVGGLCLVHLLPHAMAEASILSMIGLLLGFILPRVAEQRFHQAGASLDILLALGGLAIHATLDGTALAEGVGVGTGRLVRR